MNELSTIFSNVKDNETVVLEKNKDDIKSVAAKAEGNLQSIEEESGEAKKEEASENSSEKPKEEAPVNDAFPVVEQGLDLLEKISGFSKDKARDLVMAKVKETMSKEIAEYIKEAENEAGHTGNYGLADQIAAITWVKNNIKACASIAGMNDGYTIIYEKGNQYAGKLADSSKPFLISCLRAVLTV